MKFALKLATLAIASTTVEAGYREYCRYLTDTVSAQYSDSLVIDDDYIITDVQFRTVFRHQDTGTLTIDLIGPDGTASAIAHHVCPSTENLVETFSDEGITHDGGACDDYGEPVLPTSPLSVFDGKSSAGTWTLTVSDSNALISSKLMEWCVLIEFVDPPLADKMYCASSNTKIVENTADSPYIAFIPVKDDLYIDDVKVRTKLKHTYVGETTVAILGPDGETRSVLANAICNTADNLYETFSDASSFAPDAVVDDIDQCDDWGDDVKPFTPLSVFDQKSSLGTWTIEVVDFGSAGRGLMQEFCIFITPGSPPSLASSHAGGALGDPHVKTWTGLKYDFHGACDLVLLQNHGFSEGLGMDIHIRTKFTKQWSYIHSAALRIGEDVLEVVAGKNGGTYWFNGEERANLSDGISGFPIEASQVNSHSRKYVISLHSGESVTISTFKDFVRVDVDSEDSKDFAGSLGLMGTYAGGELIGRDSTTLFDDVVAFGLEWQVQADEPMLFHTVEGVQAPESCALPATQTTRRRLGEVSMDDAELACSRVNPEDRDNCIFDVLATNDKDMAGAY